MRLSVYVRSGPSSGQVFPLPDAGVTLIGRNASNHVVLLDRRVSANHCVLRPKRSGEAFVLLDARSRHGTTLNGRRVEKGLVGFGDVLTMGPFELEVVETPPGQYEVPPARPAAARPTRFEIAPRGWRKEGRPLPPGSATVMGRGPFCHIGVDDAFASACHCVLCLDPTDDGRMPFVIDLYSSNGTYINRRPIHRKHLLPGDVLVIGDHQFKLRRLEAEEAAPPEPEVEIPPAPPRQRVATTTVMPPDEPAEPVVPEGPEPVTLAPEPPEEEPVEEIEAAPPPPSPEPPAPAPTEGEPSVADVLTPVEPTEVEEGEEALTDEDLEPIETPEPEPEEPGAGPPSEAPAREPEPPVPEPARPRAEEAPSAGPTAEFVRRDSETQPLPRRPQAAPPADEDRSGTKAFGDTEAVEVLSLPEPAVHAQAPDRLLANAPDDYDAFFGFERPPFGLRPDPDCFFDSQHHWDALDTLVRWLKSGPPVAVLFAEPGCGKSLLVECVARRLAYRRPAPAVVRNPLAEGGLDAVVEMALAGVGEQYGDVAIEGDGALSRWRSATAALYPRKGLVAFLIDDADALPEDDLRVMGELFESEAARAVARLLLAGGEDLRDLVCEPPLAYHLGTTCYLAPLAPEEVAPYLAHRIFHASGRRALPFTQRACELIAEYAGGVPALLNVVADVALLQAFREGRRHVGRDIVQRAIREALEPSQDTS
ncbi:MAG: FHA domain-containing protein [Planctomycetota bacterium]